MTRPGTRYLLASARAMRRAVGQNQATVFAFPNLHWNQITQQSQKNWLDLAIAYEEYLVEELRDDEIPRLRDKK